MGCRSLASLQTCCDGGMKVADGREEKGELKQTNRRVINGHHQTTEPLWAEFKRIVSLHFSELLGTDDE